MTVHAFPTLPAPRRAVDLPALVARTQALLDSGVPLTLLLDLAEPEGPRSEALYQAEGGWDAGWLDRLPA
jgi:hypothetical protein